MTAEFLIYAVGGGRGHFMRGRSVQKLLCAAGRTSLLVVRRGADSGVRESDSSAQRCYSSGDAADIEQYAANSLIVDTFPRGWKNELSSKFLARFKERILVARYRQDADWDDAASLYSRILTPYSAELNEWPTLPRQVCSIGFLLRPDPPRHTYEHRRLLVFDPECRVGQRFMTRLAATAAAAGFCVSVVHESTGSFAAEKLLVIGAGYNTFYEFIAAGVDAVFLPVAKRFDDQYRRAALYNRQVSDFAGISRWLEEPFPHSVAHQAAAIRSNLCRDASVGIL